jgi:hypothetical protein
MQGDSAFTDDGPQLSRELAPVQRDYPLWHCWHSDAGTAIATHSSTSAEQRRGMPPGVTLDAPTPELLRHAIADYVMREGRVLA